MKIEGGCLCGKVRYSADTEPAFVGVCHCKNCQKQAGTAFSVIMGIPAAALSVEGELKTYEDRGDSGQAVLRRFCPNCGSPIAGDAAALPGRDDHQGWHARRYQLAEADDGGLLRQQAALGVARRRSAALRQDATARLSRRSAAFLWRAVDGDRAPIVTPARPLDMVDTGQ